ncbi:hypothetical protein X794_01225 [Dehalococcoides mccartyi CG5]|nr:hypothetical protein X794_01225 [Dehalococcoides mccartyi CG5]
MTNSFGNTGNQIVFSVLEGYANGGRAGITP